MIKAAVMGYGTIGSGVVEILEKNRDVILEKSGLDIGVKYVLDLRDFPDSPVADKIVHDFSVIEQDEEVQIVVETMGGLKPAYDFVKACLLAGKHVATSNKALVAAYGTELLEIAREKHVNFLFEASVGGGIPIIRTIFRSMKGEDIEEITGILNGTTNYILTKMDKEGSSFEKALKEAQDLGYAERNPEADVEGWDTCRKIAILAAMATGQEVNYEDISTEGITAITDVDFQYAESLGMSIKLFGSVKMEKGLAHAFVAPVMIGKDHVLYSVSDVFNGIMVKGNMLGTTMFYGSGAGKLPTASAVVSDIVEAAGHLDKNVKLGWSSERLAVAPREDMVHNYFLRIQGCEAAVMEEAKVVFKAGEAIRLEGKEEFAVMTEKMSEKDYQKASEAFSRKGGQVIQMIRAELD